jgi:hypothetical protein
LLDSSIAKEIRTRVNSDNLLTTTEIVEEKKIVKKPKRKTRRATNL